MSQAPSVGRIVHFYDEHLARAYQVRNGPYAAIITSVASAAKMKVNLSRVVGPEDANHSSHDQMLDVPFGGEKGELSAGLASWWRWPERV